MREVAKYAQELKYAKKNERKGYFSQLLEIVRLRFGPSKLGATEYLFFKLFENLLSFEEKSKFAGWRKEQEIDRALNHDEWRAIANDKLLFYAMMKGLNLPHPSVKAIYVNTYRHFPDAEVLSSIEEVKKYLRKKDNYPLFMKPVEATFGRGAISALDYDDGRDEIITGSGKIQALDTVVKAITENETKGYLFSELLKPHPDIERLCGPRLSSVRLIALMERGVPRLFHGVWKIPTGSNITDNFMHGITGNYVAAVNVESGHVERVVTGTGSALTVKTRHPDTNAELTGQYLPCWDKVIRTCLDGASALPGLRIQHWDIALCPERPIVLELNVEGSLDLHQIASQRGIYNEELTEFIRSCKELSRGNGRKR